MLWSPSWLYLWFKAFHIIAVIAWMAGMLYLPRLFVYHCDAAPGSVQSETFKVMERRLLRAIINPAMIATWALGLWLAWDAGFFSDALAPRQARAGRDPVRHPRLLRRCVRTFAKDRNTRPQRFYRIINEVPTLLMILIVILVVVKPF